ncbi:hypothetical protein NL676_016693 [Syzygium grande]|nr:hypothetical protein NL676_016693 [Syzygium grande]
MVKIGAKKFGRQDTYAFTKAMGEMLIDDVRGELPVIIIRPSVIESTIKEPFPGWIEGNRMMDPIILYYGKEQLIGFLVNPNGFLPLLYYGHPLQTLVAILKYFY